MTQSLTALFLRDLDRLTQELQLYTSEESLWNVDGGINNSGGNLAWHLIGNLNHWFGALLAKNGYQRDYKAEFSIKNIPRQTLLKEIEKVKTLVQQELPKISSDQLQGPYPGPIPYDMNMEQFLLHLLAHFGYHLGQINYHRRLLDQ